MAGKYLNQPTNQSAPAGPGHQQTPDQSSLPDHRVDDMSRKLRELELQNAQLRGTLNQIQHSMGPRDSKKEEVPQLFEPEVQNALVKMIESAVQNKIDPLASQYNTAIGNVWDRLDDARFTQKYGGDKFKKYMPQVEELRQRYINEGRFIDREEALRLVFFEETAKKPQPDPMEPTVQPEWDKTLNMFVHPGTADPWYPGQEVRQAPQQPQAPQMQQQTPQIPPQQFQQQQPQGFFDNPYEQQNQQAAPNNLQNWQNQVQNNNWEPQLPPATPNQAATFADPSQQDLDIGSSDADLDAWERRYGDVPL